MKKIFAVVLVLVMVLSLAACGKEEASSYEYNYDYDLSEYITLGDYSSIEYTPVDLTAKEGSTVSIDFVGKFDGVAFENGTGSTSSLVIGSGQMIPGFEDGIIGMTIGETRTIDATFPEDYKNNPDFAGKTAQFDITLNGVDGYTSQKDADRDAIWSAFFKKCEVIKYPELEMDNMVKQQREYYENYAKAYGYELSDMLAQMGTTEEDFINQLTESSKASVSQDMALYALVRAEGIEIDDESYEVAKNELLASYGVDNDKDFKAQYGISVDDPALVNSIEVNVYLKKALDLLEKNAVAI